jgi:rubrerythrin
MKGALFMSEFYLFAEQNGVKWYKCKRCQAAARGAIPAGNICPVCYKPKQIYNSDKIKAFADALYKRGRNT